MDSGLGYGEIKYVHINSSQLVCACSEDTARDAVWAGSLARVKTLKCLTNVGHWEGERTVLGSRLRQWHCVILNNGQRRCSAGPDARRRSILTLLKSPATINAASGYVVSSLQMVKCSSLRAVVVSA